MSRTFSTSRSIWRRVYARASWTMVLVALVALAANQVHAQTVTPKGTAVTTAPNTSGATYVFTVKNPTTKSALYNITVGCSGYVTSCSESSGGEVSLAAGRSATVTATYSTGTNGTGQVTLTAQDETTLASNQGYINVSPPTTATPVVTADNTTWYTDQNASTNYPSFHVQNTGNTAATYTISVACSNIPSCSVRANPGQIAPGTSANVIVDYTSGPASGGSGTMTLTATSPYSETASRSLTIVPLSDSVTVTPKGGAVTLNRGASSSVNFTVADVGNSSPVTYTLTCGYSGTVTSCSAPDTVRVTAGSPQTVPVSYTVSSSLAGGSGSVTLTASINTGFHLYSDQGSYSGAVPDGRMYWVAVTPDGGSATAEANASGRSFTFQVKNTGNASGTYNLSVTQCAGATSSCSLGSSTVAIDPAQTVSVPVSFSTGGVGQPITLNLQAVDGTYNDIGSVTVQPVTYSDSVAALDATPSTPAGATGMYHFSVTNTGTADSATYSLQVMACNAPVINCAAPTSVTVARGATKTVAVSYSTQATPGSGSITLRAYLQMANLYQSSATGNIAVTSAAPLVVDLSAANFGKTVTRDRCLTISLGRGAAYECGDLRLVHALPTVRTMNTARTPVLLYTSQHASPRPIIVADVTLPSGDPLPTTVQATVSVAGNPAVTGSASWNGADWGAPGAKRRIGIALDASTLPTGAYPYTMTVTTQGSAGGKTQTTQDTLIVVNRASSPFGTGWWLAGVEQLVKPAMDTTMRLWIGGDGSARLYHKIAGSVWTAPAVDGLDSLTWDPSLDRYTRWDLHRLRTIFDGGGTHIQTVNRTQDTTRFTWSGGQLQSIAVPTPNSSIAYSFGYIGGTLTSVTSPDGRQTSVARSGSTLTVTDPDLTTIQFAYGSANAITSRTDRRGNVVTYGYDAAGRVDSVAANMGASPAVVTAIHPAESQPTATTAQIPDSVYTLVNGPRRDTTITRVWIDRFGEPTRLVDALNGATTLERSDNRFPALVTRMTGPTGFVTTASYDSHGNVQTSVAVNPLGDGVSDTTRYSWDPTFDFVTQIIQPLGESVTMQYDPANGNRLYQYPGSDPARKVQYVYDPTTRRIAGWQLPGSAARDSVGYDALGNVAFTRTPLGHYTRYVTDAAGRDTLVIAPLDTLGQRHVFTRTVLDAMGRDTLSATSSDSTSFYAAASSTVRKAFDPEGNVDSVYTTSGGDPVQPGIGTQRHVMTYDNLNRQLSEITLSASGSTVVNKSFTYDAAGNRTTDGKGGAVIVHFDALNRPLTRASTTDAAQFTYDAAGRLLTATNRYAQIGRSYYPGGALRTDTLRIAVTDTSVASPARFATHVYVDSMGYDADGRRSVLRFPDATSVSYGYDPVFGALQTITGPGGDSFVAAYDLAGRLVHRARLAGTADSVAERVSYDLDSRLAADSVTGYGASAGATRAQQIFYDARDKALMASQTSESFNYAPLGPVTDGFTVGGSSESFTVDALGNAYTHMFNGVTTTYDYTPGSSRLDDIRIPNGTYTDTTFYGYDTYGNRLGESTWHYLINPTPGFTVNCPKATCVHNANNYTYSDENRLVYTHFQSDTSARTSQTPASPYTTDEWFRYDALGRRVWARLMHSSNCSLQDPVGGCANTMLRSVWDGDQLLYEVQVSGVDTVASSENDSPSGGASYGVVKYIHAADLDAPLAIYKNGSLAVLPFQNYRGAVDVVACPRMASCGDVPVPGLTDGLNSRDGGKSTGPLGFYGTIQGGMKTGSGLVYQRNRFVDPVSGKFTQADPIGLAGGLNAWGFVSGDPVNYADPFGLCPDCLGPLALAGVGVAEEGIPVLGQVVGTVTVAAAGVWAAYEGVSALGDYFEARRERGKNSGATAAGQTAGGRATDEHGKVLGPSGRPAVHDKDFPTRKRAKDDARNDGKGEPVNHPSPTRGRPHFHPTGADGEKVPGSPHYNYPR